MWNVIPLCGCGCFQPEWRHRVGKGGDGRLIGVARNEVLLGKVGDEFLNGGSGDDTLYGGAGNDQLKDGGGDDRVDNIVRNICFAPESGRH
jgi:Ca2+-binding RTX toxin-like protein